VGCSGFRELFKNNDLQGILNTRNDFGGFGELEFYSLKTIVYFPEKKTPDSGALGSGKIKCPPYANMGGLDVSCPNRQSHNLGGYKLKKV